MRSISTTPLPTRTLTEESASFLDGLEISNINLVYENKRDKPVLNNMSLLVPTGTTLALLGPSGCGKTSLLRAIAGLETPLSGEISMGDEVLFRSETKGGRATIKKNIKPEHRKVGMIFQDLALFPHLTVGGNVSYGLPRNQEHLMLEALELVNLSGYENRRISTLSGGQQQRVALARALAPKPEVLLLDEPFSSLDEPTSVELRSHIHHLLAELQTTAIFVTHDQEEAFIVGDQVAVMNSEGHIVQQGSPTDLYTLPENRWVADFVGHANLIKGVADGTHAKTALGNVKLLEPLPETGKPIDILIRPEDLVFAEPAGEADTLEISLIEYYGHDTLYLLTSPSDKNAYTDEGQIWVRLVDHTKSYARGNKVSLKHVGPPAVSYLKN